MSNLFQFTPPYVFHYRVPDHDAIKQKYLPNIKDFYSRHQNDTKYNWSATTASNMKTSYHIDNTKFFDKHFCNQIIYSAIEDLFKTHPLYKGKVLRSQISSIWWNVYKTGDCIDFHSHGTAQDISGLYILESNEINPTIFVVSNGFCENELHRANYADEGSVLLFPSSLRHYAPMVQNDRITVAFNVKIIRS